jgi:hypothetical protein
MTALHVGVDLGQARDHTAIVVVERLDKMSGRPVQFEGEHGIRLVDHYVVVHVERVQPGTPYPEQVAQVGRLLDAPGPLRAATLTVDQTGVGRAVFDLFTEAWRNGRCGAHRPRGVTFTGGREEHGLNVPKRQLVSNLVALAQTGCLDIAPAVPNGDALARELKAFTLKVTTAGNDSYEAQRESDHDDLVCALMLAVWRPRRREVARGMTLDGAVVTKE